MGRPRSEGRLDLPHGLIPHPRKSGGRTIVYWYWHDPRDGKEKPLKCPDDKATAIRRAKELNAIVAREMADNVVEDIASCPVKRSIGTQFNVFAAHCLTLFEQRGLAENTMRSRKCYINAAIRWFGEIPLHEIGVPEMAALIKSYTDQGKNRTAQSIRALMADVWKEAYQEGLLPPDHPNPALITRRPVAKVKRARLTLETFLEIHAQAKVLAEARGDWIANSQLLALVTGQRLDDLGIAQFRKGKDWQKAWVAFQEGEKHDIHPYPFIEDGLLWVVQQKTGAMIQIPLDLRLDAINLSVGEVVEGCRSKMVSRYLIHHTIPFGNAPVGSQVHINSISRGFMDARRATDITWPGKTPPTFHEIRSLSERLYKAQGIDPQALLGHRHKKMTEVYDDPRQAEWTKLMV
jgi:integrase